MLFGLMLSGPLGLQAAKAVSSIELPAGLELRAVVGTTPGLDFDFAKETKAVLGECGVPVVPTEGGLAGSLGYLCVGWRKLVSVSSGSEAVYVVHDSLLPKLRGWNPLVTSVEDGDLESGITIFLANEEIDSGPIVSQKKFSLPDGCDISQALSIAGAALGEILPSFFLDYSSGLLQFVDQDPSKVTVSLWRDEEDYKIDWKLDASQIARFIKSRGSPYSGATSSVADKQIKIIEATVLAADFEIVNRVPGKVLSLNAGKPVVVCGSGLLKVERITTEDSQEFTLSSIRSRFR
jgi:methionyl-tRNA formyltransferase